MDSITAKQGTRLDIQSLGLDSGLGLDRFNLTAEVHRVNPITREFEKRRITWRGSSKRGAKRVKALGEIG